MKPPNLVVQQKVAGEAIRVKFCGADSQRVGGVMVSIVAFQAVDPGSIPGRRRIFLDEGDKNLK